MPTQESQVARLCAGVLDQSLPREHLSVAGQQRQQHQHQHQQQCTLNGACESQCGADRWLMKTRLDKVMAARCVCVCVCAGVSFNEAYTEDGDEDLQFFERDDAESMTRSLRRVASTSTEEVWFFVARLYCIVLAVISIQHFPETNSCACEGECVRSARLLCVILARRGGCRLRCGAWKRRFRQRFEIGAL